MERIVPAVDVRDQGLDRPLVPVGMDVGEESREHRWIRLDPGHAQAVGGVQFALLAGIRADVDHAGNLVEEGIGNGAHGCPVSCGCTAESPAIRSGSRESSSWGKSLGPTHPTAHWQ